MELGIQGGWDSQGGSERETLWREESWKGLGKVSKALQATWGI